MGSLKSRNIEATPSDKG